MNHNEIHYLQMEKKCNSDEPFVVLTSLPKFFQELQRLIQKVRKETRQTTEELHVSLASVMICGHDSAIRKTMGKNGIMGELQDINHS